MNLIDKDAVISILKRDATDGGCMTLIADSTAREIEALPTIEAVPVKHGRWIEEGLVDGNQNRYCRCSECGKGEVEE